MYYLQDAAAPISAIGLYNDLCQRIISVNLEPGDRISENAISTEYGVSRSVLRTVFARLQQINFVEVYPQRGTFVRLIDVDHITSASTIRYVVERNAVYDIIFSEVATKLLEDLESMMARMKEALAGGSIEDIKLFKTLTAQYHLRIIQEVMTPNALSLLYEIRVHLTRWTNIDVSLQGLEQQLLEYNQDILDALRDRKLQKALRQIKEHFLLLVSNTDMVRSVHPNYFKE